MGTVHIPLRCQTAAVTAAMSAGKLATAAQIHILGVSGSLRKGSYNTKMLKAAQKLLPEGVSLDIARIDDLPLLNTDLEEKLEGGGTRFPEPVERFRKQVREADAVLFSNPEYNYSIAAPMKNAIDWASRPLPNNEWAQKPAAIMSVGGGFSGINGQQALRSSGVFLDLLFLQKPGLFHSLRDGTPFDEGTGELTDPVMEARLRALVEALVAWTHRLQQT